MEFGRLVTAMVTPFDQQLQIDWDRLATLIDYLIEDQQSDSIVVCGTTGEAPTLTETEKLKLFEFVVQHVKGRCGIIAGTGNNNTAQSIELSQKAEEIGVDGLLLVAPYYNRPTQEGLYRHFRAIAESVSKPVMIYNVPKRTGVNISAETTLRLAGVANITSTKEASGDLEQISQIIREAPEGFKVYSGDDSLTLPILAAGGYGIVSVASHVIGAQIKQMMNVFLEGKHVDAAGLHSQLLNIFKGLFLCPNPVAVKYALQLHDMPVGETRLPLVPPTTEEEGLIRALFEQH